MVEPDLNNFSSGVNNFKLNGFDGEFIQSFVGKGHFEVDPFLSGRKLSHLDILHVDIQGYEIEMLEGCRNTLKERLIDYLFVSTHSQPIHDRVVAELNHSSYRVEVSSDFDNDTTSFDGFVFASSPQAKQIFANFALLGRSKIVESRPQVLLQGLLEIQKPAPIKKNGEA